MKFTKNDRTSFLIAALGVVLGVVVTLLCVNISQSRRQRVSAAHWQKLGVILREVEDR